MKRWIALAVAAALPLTCPATLLPEGTDELGLSGVVDFQTIGETLLDLNVSYGYYFVDDVQAGVLGSFRTDENYTAWALGLTMEYNFDLGTEFVPFVGGAVKYMQVDSEYADDGNGGVVLGVAGGAKFFLTEYLALTGGLTLEVATAEVFPSGDDLDIWHARLDAGLRVFF